MKSEERDSRGGTWKSVCPAVIYSEVYPSSAHSEPKTGVSYSTFNLKNETASFLVPQNLDHLHSSCDKNADVPSAHNLHTTHSSGEKKADSQDHVGNMW